VVGISIQHVSNTNTSRVGYDLDGSS
jgi:hypothetical protein